VISSEIRNVHRLCYNSNMAKAGKQSTTTSKARQPRRAKGKTLRELNAWLNANYVDVVKSARKNCVLLTGKPTFGGNSRGRKSA
jgi:hypothetical protein